MNQKDLISYLNRVYKYLEIYGIDKYNLRENLLLSFMINELITENENTGLLNEEDISSLYQLIYDVLNNDTLIKFKKSEISYIGLPNNIYQLIYDFVYG
jgi:hypothetical protein